jgi:ketosteroid isomerase-like protein
MSNEQQNLDTVRAIYDAVGRNDLDAILDRVHDDVDWAAEAAGDAAPWYGVRTGRDGVASFFADLRDSIERNAFTPHAFAASDEHVHVLVDWTITAITAGRQASMTMHHYWRLRDGKVALFRGSEDTAVTASVFETVAVAS